MIKMIFATGPSGEFGYNEGLPWVAVGDLANFKKFTNRSILVMSEATFRSLPSSLPGRQSVVLGDSECFAKNGDEPDILLPETTDLKVLCEFLDAISKDEDVCVIGGRKLLLEASRFVGLANITNINKNLVREANVFMIPFDIIHNLKGRNLNSSIRMEDYGYVEEWS